MYYHYEELNYDENCPKDILFEVESDEKALEFVSEYMLQCKYCGYYLVEITEPKIEKNGCVLYLTYNDIRTIKKKRA
jgi:hypothetical protein